MSKAPVVNSPDPLGTANGCDWTPSLAESLARLFGLAPLSELHWRVISECREEWARSGSPPELERLAAVSRLSAAELRSLFPRGLVAFHWILAGLLPPSTLWTDGPGTSEPRAECATASTHGQREALVRQSGLNGSSTAIPADLLQKPMGNLTAPFFAQRKGRGS